MNVYCHLQKLKIKILKNVFSVILSIALLINTYNFYAQFLTPYDANSVTELFFIAKVLERIT